jgi:hypothetical protein
MPVIEIPLSLMDSSFYWYLDANPEEVFETFKQLIDVVEDRGGVLVILWHNNFFDDTLYWKWGDVYGRIIDEVTRRGAYVATVHQVQALWKERMKTLAPEVDGASNGDSGGQGKRDV